MRRAAAEWQKGELEILKARRSGLLLVLRTCLFFFDELVDESGHGAATDAPGRFGLRPVRISHKAKIKRLFRPHGIIVVEGELATFAALKVFGHEISSPHQLSKTPVTT